METSLYRIQGGNRKSLNLKSLAGLGLCCRALTDTIIRIIYYFKTGYYEKNCVYDSGSLVPH